MIRFRHVGRKLLTNRDFPFFFLRENKFRLELSGEIDADA